MKKLLAKFIILALFSIAVQGHGLAVHVAQYDRIIEYYEENDPDNTYLTIMQTYPEYFKYGSILPDMQYVSTQKKALEDLYQGLADYYPPLVLRYDLSLTDVPESGPGSTNGSYSFGINTHDFRYAFQFAQYLLDQANLLDPPGLDYGYENTASCITRGQKIALASGYFAHLSQDVIAHNYWVPQLTAQSGLAELNMIIDDDGLGHIPGIQSHYAVEANHDYQLGMSACQNVADVVSNLDEGVWVRIGQLEPSVPLVVYADGDALSVIGTPNPALVFFHEVLQQWIDTNPYNLPDDYRTGDLISITGFFNECDIWRFGNRYYPEIFGYGSFGNSFSTWMANHIGFESTGLSILDQFGVVDGANFIVQLFQWIKNRDNSWDTVWEMQFNSVYSKSRDGSAGAFQAVLGMMRYNISDADQLVADNPDKIDITEYNRLKNNAVFTNPNYFDGFDYFEGVEAQYFDKIGPADKIYETWAPDYRNSYVFGVMNALNGYSPNHELTSSLGVYDAYFSVDGVRYNNKNFPPGHEHNFEAVVEVFSLGEMSDGMPISAKLVLDHIDGDDLIFKSASTTIQQSPFDYNNEERTTISIPFHGTEIASLPNSELYQGIHIALYAGSSTIPFFTTDWDSYSLLDIVVGNNRYNQYSSYGSSPFSYPIHSMNIKYSSFFSTVELEENVINVNGEPLLSGVSNSYLLQSVVDANIEQATIEYDNNTSIQHRYWNLDESAHFTGLSNVVGHTISPHQKAMYEEIKQIEIFHSPDVQFHDPWYISNPEAAPENWIQPDEFRPLSEMTATGDYEVFLNQNDAFHPEIPIYSLKAPQVYADQNGIYECTGWSGEGIKFDASGATSTTNIETDVVFLTSGAQVWPTYTQVNTSPGYTLILGLDEVLTIPPGAEIECASGFIIDAYFGDIDIQGEPNNPVRLYSQTTWGGIDSWVGGTLDQSIVLENVIIENAVHPIYNSSVYLENQHATIKNCKFINSGGIRAVSTQTMDIRNNIFQNINPNSDNQGILIVSISNDNDPYDIDIVNNTFINFKRSVEVTPTNIGNYYNMENNIFYYSDALNNVNSIAFVHSFQRSGTENVNYNLVYGFDEDGFDFTIYKIIDLVYGSPNFLDEASNNFHLTSGSNAIDKGDPALPFDSDDTRKDIGAYYYPQLSGVLSEDIVIEGEASIGGDFTLSAGHTMTVMPGTEILVAEDVDITIQGTLNAMGTASEPIAFMPNQPTSDKRYWGGISVNSGEVNIKHAEIQNAYNSLYLTSASATMSDLNLHHNYYGIRIVNSSISSIKNSSFSDNYMYALYVSGVSPQLDIASNSFTNNRYGLYLRDYSGKISGNSITGTYYDGIRFAGQSSANMTVARIPGQTPYAVNNHIANTSYGSGITVYYGAFPTLGAYNDFGNKVYGGFNHFYANTGKNSAVNFNTGSLDARLNWWTPGSYNQSKFDWNPSVEDYVPGGGGGSKVGKVSDLSLALDYIYEGDYLFVDSSYVEAIEYYGLAINEEPDDSLAVRALIGMTGCYNALGDNDGMILHLNDIVNTYSGLLVSVSAHDYLVNMQVRGHEYLEALETNLDVIEEYSDMDEVDEAIADSWFDRMVIYQLLALENDGLGKSVPAAEQRSLARKTADFVLSEYTYSTAANLIRVLNGEDEIEVEKTVKPITFALHNVYPNPFNPSVTIPYDLASTSDFSIVIYDVLGREVWSHKQIGQMAGNYSLVWNGMNQAGQLASSGLYLIRFTSPEYTGTQKALLLR